MPALWYNTTVLLLHRRAPACVTKPCGVETRASAACQVCLSSTSFSKAAAYVCMQPACNPEAHAMQMRMRMQR